MSLRNTAHGYGAVTRALHWIVFAAFAYQFVGANLMTRIGRDTTVLGMNQDALYNWHKSIGLVLLGLAFARITWRRTAGLPDWSDALLPAERTLVHRLETLMYGLMFALPLTGYLFVTAGGYGVKLFGVWDLPAPFGKQPSLAVAAQYAHVLLSYLAVMVISWHVGMGLRKQLVDSARYLQRMAPFGDARSSRP